MVQAITSALGAFSGQSRREVVQRNKPESAINAIAAAKDIKTAKLLRKQYKDEQIMNILTQPEVLGIAMVLGGIAAANYIPLSPDPEARAFLKGIATTATVTMGLGYAGVGDLTSLSVGLAAGGGALVGELVDETTGSIWNKLNPFNWRWPLGPIWNQ